MDVHSVRREYDTEPDRSLGGLVHVDPDFDSRERGERLGRHERRDANGHGHSRSPNQSRAVPHLYRSPPDSRTIPALEPLEDAMPPPEAAHRSQRPRGRPEPESTGARVPITVNGNYEDVDERRGNIPISTRRGRDLDIVMSEDESSSLGGPSGSVSRDDR